MNIHLFLSNLSKKVTLQHYTGESYCLAIPILTFTEMFLHRKSIQALTSI
uniref:Uncharacterized protein n=1 Tax=Arundo donax TaxID=35708 RepID=A0A0A9B833_ARUDO